MEHSFTIENSATLYNADCLEALKTLEDNSVDSVITDPPYEIGFMGRAWDSTGIAYNVGLWAECLRVLKPGGHLLAFGATRSYHRMTVAIEDAGFEIRDSIHWTYGSGFPKSLNVSKAIDKAAGALKHASSRFNVAGRTDRNLPNPNVKGYIPPAPSTDEAKQWKGWGTALKPSHEPIVVARKPLTGTVANTVLEYGTGALNIDECRIGDSTTGRWPANTILTHNHDCDIECTPGCPVLNLDQQSTNSARYFQQTQYQPEDNPIVYIPKPSKKERNLGDADNKHPTVKPIQLMRYLIKLVTPPGGTVLDPFTGSGTTGVAAIFEGNRFIGVELTADYLPIIEKRLEWASEQYALENTETDDTQEEETLF